MAEANSPSPADDQQSLDSEHSSEHSEQETEGLTEEQIAELKEAYCLLTRDGEGPVTSRKLGRVLRLLGINPSDTELNDLMVQIDPKGKGTVDFTEFVKAMTRRTLDVHCEEQLREAFRVLDKDGDGYLSVGELRHVLTTRGERMTPQEMDDMIRQVDSAGRGKISCDDFVKIVTS